MMNYQELKSKRLEVARGLFDTYETYKRTEIRSRRFKQSEMIEWLRNPHYQKALRSTTLGNSSEGRAITLHSYGEGKTKVLLWSQMHGDEPTATMALLDIMNFLSLAPNDPVVSAIRKSLTLLMIPMLNPDGAERFTRRTAQLVDMNRDAAWLVTPEANILRQAQHTYKPHFGFNLHDQEPRYTVGDSTNVAAIALLAPAMNERRDDNDVRLRAKKVASILAEAFGSLVPGHVAKYEDAYDARAFGDSIQRWGTSTVLIESGGWPNDRDKMFLRKLNYVGLLSVFRAIAEGEIEGIDTGTYEALPFNSKNMYDVIVRGVELQWNNHVPSIRSDIALNVEEEQGPDGKLHLLGKVVDLGDLGRYGAFEERDGKGRVVKAEEVRIDKAIPWDQVELLLK